MRRKTITPAIAGIGLTWTLAGCATLTNDANQQISF